MTELLGRLDDILSAVREREASEPEAFPARTIADLYAIGLPRAPFSVGLGGADGSLRDSVEAIETLASASPAAALLISMPLSLAGFVVAGAVAAPAAHRAACTAQAEQVAADYRAGRIYAACNSEKGAGVRHRGDSQVRAGVRGNLEAPHTAGEGPGSGQEGVRGSDQGRASRRPGREPARSRLTVRVWEATSP